MATKSSRSERDNTRGTSSKQSRTSQQINAALATETDTSGFIVDNSVWARLGTEPTIKSALEAIVNRYSPSLIWLCPPTALEIGHGAPSGRAHTALIGHLSVFPSCPVDPSTDEVLAIQNRLWVQGLVRAAGAIDVLIAAYALANDATVLHYDSDFGHVAKAEPTFKHQWIVPRGSI